MFSGIILYKFCGTILCYRFRLLINTIATEHIEDNSTKCTDVGSTKPIDDRSTKPTLDCTSKPIEDGSTIAESSRFKDYSTSSENDVKPEENNENQVHEVMTDNVINPIITVRGSSPEESAIQSWFCVSIVYWFCGTNICMLSRTILYMFSGIILYKF
jgi:hypothetical protein